MLSTYAVVSLTASMSRKSSRSASGIGSFCHEAPPSAVRSTVPPAPLAQATLSLTALTPRSRAVTPLACGVQRGATGAAATAPATATARQSKRFHAGILP